MKSGKQFNNVFNDGKRYVSQTPDQNDYAEIPDGGPIAGTYAVKMDPGVVHVQRMGRSI